MKYFLTFLWLLCVLSSTAFARELTFLELYGPKLEQEREVALSSVRGKKTLLNFWRSDCPPCIIEMDLLLNTAISNPALRLVLISLEHPTDVREFFQETSLNNIASVWVIMSHPKPIMEGFGNNRGVIPYSVMLRADGKACDNHFGMLTPDVIGAWLKNC